MPRGRFGIHNGQFIPETLMSAATELEEAYEYYKEGPQSKARLKYLLEEYTDRPSRLYYAERMIEDLGGARICLKREDLNHTSSHKINNALGQVLLARKMGKTRVIAETGVGQHGMAIVTAATLLGLECEVYVGKEGMDRQALSIYRTELLGARVHPVISGTQTLKDAVNETLRGQIDRISDTHYVIGSVMSPHLFPMMVRDFQSIISREIKEQLVEKEGKLSNMIIACVGGGSNAMRTFYEFIGEEDMELVGCEAAGRGVETEQVAATIATGRLDIFHDMKSYLYQDEYGQIAPMYSVSAGLNYPNVELEHAQLHDSGRVQYVSVTGDEIVDSFKYLPRMEGIIPAAESAHAMAYVRKIVGSMDKDQIIVINPSGRGDKNVAAIIRYREVELYEQDIAGFWE